MRRAPLTALIGPANVLAALLIVINVVAFAAWTAPRLGTRLGVAGAAGGVVGALSRIDAALQAARATYGRIGDAEDEVGAFRALLVTDAGGAQLLGMLARAGEGVGIDLDDATLQYVPLDELAVVQLGLTFPVAGTYEAVRGLLDELVALPLFLVIDGIGLQSYAPGATAARTGTGGQAIRVDLALSVFVDEPALTGDAIGASTPPARPLVRRPLVDALREALERDNPDEIADAVLAVLEVLPPLPVDPRSLDVDLERLETPAVTAAPQRNLFSVVLPPPPAQVVEEPEPYVEPEPLLPVRLLGVLRLEDRWHASLADDMRVFIVETGDTLPNGVDIVEVGKDFVTVRYRNQTTVLRLEGTR